jgi:hypothetical protein
MKAIPGAVKSLSIIFQIFFFFFKLSTGSLASPSGAAEVAEEMRRRTEYLIPFALGQAHLQRQSEHKKINTCT